MDPNEPSLLSYLARQGENALGPDDPSMTDYLARQGGNAVDQVGRFLKLTGPVDFTKTPPTPVEYLIRSIEHTLGVNKPTPRPVPQFSPSASKASDNPLLTALAAY